MKIEVICPKGHRIPEDCEGTLLFSPLGDDLLHVDLQCFKCGLGWQMSLKLFTCEERNLREGDVSLGSFRQ